MMTEHLFDGYLFCKKKDVYEKVCIDEILYFRADGDYIEGVLTEERTIFFRGTLSALAKTLPPPQFVRTHRSYMVHTDKVTGVNFKEGVVLIDEFEIPLSKPNSKLLSEQMIRL